MLDIKLLKPASCEFLFNYSTICHDIQLMLNNWIVNEKSKDNEEEEEEHEYEMSSIHSYTKK